MPKANSNKKAAAVALVDAPRRVTRSSTRNSAHSSVTTSGAATPAEGATASQARRGPGRPKKSAKTATAVFVLPTPPTSGEVPSRAAATVANSVTNGIGPLGTDTGAGTIAVAGTNAVAAEPNVVVAGTNVVAAGTIAVAADTIAVAGTNATHSGEARSASAATTPGTSGTATTASGSTGASTPGSAMSSKSKGKRKRGDHGTDSESSEDDEDDEDDEAQVDPGIENVELVGAYTDWIGDLFKAIVSHRVFHFVLICHLTSAIGTP